MGKSGHRVRYTERDDDVETQREDGHLLPKKKGFKQVLPSNPSKGINLANTLILNFQPPEQ